MVKFSKELEAQLIPEWKDAFVNYWQLKKLVKRIKLSQTPNPPPPSPVAAFISSLAGKFRRLPSDHHLSQVKKKKKNDSFEDGDPNEHHETELSQFFSEEDEVKIFFETLNEELEKVNEFYGSRESEFMERGDSLREQLGILLEFKRILEDRRRKISPSASFSRSSSTFSPRHSSFSENTESNATSAEVSETDEAIAALEKHGVTFINAAVRGKTKKGNKPMMALRVHIPATTPSRTISAVMGMLWEDLINNPKKDVSGDSISRKKIQWAEKMIRGAFVELYKGLGLLKTFSWLNMKAFVKILKKFDKVANQKASASYLQGVKKSAFISSDKITLLRLMESAICYFTAGSFGMRRGEICKSGTLYWELAYLSSFLPYYWRAMQCARRWFDDNDLDHLANLGKYASAMVAAGARLTYSRQDTHFWFIIVLVTSFVATIYQLYWDFAKDWGILNPKSRNPWLRDELILKSKGIYYLSIVLNVILRVAWVESVLQLHKLHIRNVESKMLDFLLASLEVIRRGHWNFYRLENEQLNNVGKYRAVKTVPLPFLDADSDG